MKYKCQLLSLNQLTVGPKGFVMPLCDHCSTCDCSNPIEKKRISILGIVKEYKIYSKGSEDYFVVACMGFSKE